MYSIAAEHAKGKFAQDNIFASNNKAVALADKLGNDKVINATVGSILDEEGNLVVLNVVQEEYKKLTPRQYAAYAPIQGYQGYLEACIEQCFCSSRPEGYIRAVSTSGGTGVLHHAVHNYSAIGDEILISDWHWGAYDSVIQDNLRKIPTFSLINEEGHFDSVDFKKQVEYLVSKQQNTVILFNGIANNPTGFCLTIEEWQLAVNIIRESVEGTDKNIIFVPDVAYLDYSGEKEECRRFFKVFSNLPKNILTIVAYTLSKGFTIYGQRMGAMIAVTSDEGVAQEFVDINQYSSRATWSNGNSAPQQAMISICKDAEKVKRLDLERKQYFELIQQRADIFMKEAQECNIKFVPYISGFFITIPVDGAQAVCDKLQEENIFMVPLKKGIRLAVCSVSKKKMTGLAAKLREAMDAVGAKQ